MRYCLSDVVDDDAESASALAGVPLVPLADGTCGAFELASDEKEEPSGDETEKRVVYYVPTAEEATFLFRGARGVCVDVFGGSETQSASSLGTLGVSAHGTLDPELTRRFAALAETRGLNLRRVDDAATLASLMPRVLPAAWKCSDADLRRGVVADAPPVPWRPPRDDTDRRRETEPETGDERNGHPSAETLAFLWRKLRQTCASGEDLAAFRGWPLLPVADAADTESASQAAGAAGRGGGGRHGGRRVAVPADGRRA